MSDVNNVFSLEDDDCNDLFITQEAKSDENLVNEMAKSDGEYDSFLGVEAMDFASPCVSVVQGLDSVYPDISEAEDFENGKQLPIQDR